MRLRFLALGLAGAAALLAQAAGAEGLRTTPPGVTRLVPGTNITLSPSSGVGDVTVNAAAGSGTGCVPGGIAGAVQYDSGAGGCGETSLIKIISNVLTLSGSTSGAISFPPQVAAGTYNWNWPIAAGAAGAFLTSQGGGTAAMTWTTLSASAPITLGGGAIGCATCLTGNQTITLSGDATGSGATAITVDVTELHANTLTSGDACTTNGTIIDCTTLLAASATTDTTDAANIASGTLPAARLPNPSATTLGGIESAAAVTNEWIASISTLGVPSLSQPAFSNLSGSATTAQLPGTGATTVAGATCTLGSTCTPSLGNLAAGQIPAGSTVGVTTQAGAAYTLTSSDCTSKILFTSASAVTLTLPDSLPVGCQVSVEQAAAGQVTCSPAAGATLSNAHGFNKTFGANAVIGLTVDTNAGGAAAAYVLTGDGA